MVRRPMFGINNFWLFCLILNSFRDVFGSDRETTAMDNVQIKLDSGILQGNIKTGKNGQSYYNFQGIPYAVPPVGSLRFKDPVPYKKWKGVLNATNFGPSCVQIMLKQTTFSVVGQEDCLYLNVYSPRNPHEIKQPLPVMVWIYGGSFREGSSNIYGPEYLMEEDVIVVTFNYRLGVFGFLSTQDENAPGNYGLKDMVLALKWVKKNISKFGGDPNRVTIFGESAGAASVGYLLMVRQAKNLFNGAIMQSGTPLCPWSLHRNPRKVAFDLGVSLGIVTNSSAALVRYLRSVELPKAHQSMIDVNLVNFVDAYQNGGPFGPVLEIDEQTGFLTKDSYKALKNGDFDRVPILMGINSQESKFFSSMMSLVRPLLFLYDVSPSSLARPAMNVKSLKDRRTVGLKIRQFYFNSGSFVGASDTKLAEFFSDDLFVRPVTKTAQLLSRHVPVYFYVYDYEGAMGKAWLNYASEDNRNVKGVAHAEELWYLWNPAWGKLTLESEEEKLTSKRLVKLWTNFAKFRNPTPNTEPVFANVRWPKVEGPDVDYFYIGKNIRIDRNFKERNLRFWDNLYANYSHGPFETY